MKRIFLALLLACVSGVAGAQNYTAVTASSIMDARGPGYKLSVGQICLLGTNALDVGINFTAGGGGMVLNRAVCAGVTNGAISAGFQVANPANTSPAGIYYHVTVKDTNTQQVLVNLKLVQFSGATFNFDNYQPNVGQVVPPSGASINGPFSVNGNIAGTGSATFDDLFLTGVNGGMSVANGDCSRFTPVAGLNIICPILAPPGPGWVKWDGANGPLRLVGIAATGVVGHCLKLAANGVDIIDSGDICASGITGLTSNGSVITSTLPILLPDGTYTAPAGSWSAEPGMGSYRKASHKECWTNQGVTCIVLFDGLNGDVVLPSNWCYGWSNSNSNADSGTFYATLCPLNGGVQFKSPADGTGANATVSLGAVQINTLAAGAQYGSNQTATGAPCETAFGITTLSTGSTTTNTGANCLPANAIIDAVVYRITTTITTSANFTIGDGTIAARFCGTQSTLTAGTTGICFVQADQTGTSGPRQTSAAVVRVTLNANPGAGAMRLIVYYHTWTAPTS